MGQRSPDRIRGPPRPGLSQGQGSDSLSRGPIATAVLIILGQKFLIFELEDIVHFFIPEFKKRFGKGINRDLGMVKCPEGNVIVNDLLSPFF